MKLASKKTAKAFKKAAPLKEDAIVFDNDAAQLAAWGKAPARTLRNAKP